MKKICTMHVEVTFKPWVRWYVKALVLFCWAFKRQPNMERVMSWIKKGMNLKVVHSHV